MQTRLWLPGYVSQDKRRPSPTDWLKNRHSVHSQHSGHPPIGSGRAVFLPVPNTGIPRVTEKSHLPVGSTASCTEAAQSMLSGCSATLQNGSVRAYLALTAAPQSLFLAYPNTRWGRSRPFPKPGIDLPAFHSAPKWHWSAGHSSKGSPAGPGRPDWHSSFLQHDIHASAAVGPRLLPEQYQSCLRPLIYVHLAWDRHHYCVTPLSLLHRQRHITATPSSGQLAHTGSPGPDLAGSDTYFYDGTAYQSKPCQSGC